MPTPPVPPAQGGQRRRGLDRRGFLVLAGAAGVSALVAPLTRTAPASAAVLPTSPFTLGVASGDPWPDGFVIWTRLALDPLAADGLGAMPLVEVEVAWEVAADESFRSVVARGRTRAWPGSAHAVHVEVAGLRPATWYWYRFRVGRGPRSHVSPVGRAKTAPRHDDDVRLLSLGVASCQQWVDGRYAAQRAMAAEELDAIVFLGDYIYERKRTRTLTDYRLLYSKYKSSPDLQAAHASAPFIAVFDDHEVDNNFADDLGVDLAGTADPGVRFRRRRARAFRAMWENLPLRRTARPDSHSMLIRRGLRFGSLVDLSILDTRQYRSFPLGPPKPASPRDPGVLDPARTMLGPKQEAWLSRRLRSSRATWTLIGQQVVMAPFDYDTGEGVTINNDCWDGYPVARERLLADLAASGASNPVVLSGDAHSAWVNELRLAPDQPPVAMEFVTPSVSTPFTEDPLLWQARDSNPQVRYFDPNYHGYIRLRIRPDTLIADFRRVITANDTAGTAWTSIRWIMENGKPGAEPG